MVRSSVYHFSCGMAEGQGGGNYAYDTHCLGGIKKLSTRGHWREVVDKRQHLKGDDQSLPLSRDPKREAAGKMLSKRGFRQ